MTFHDLKHVGASLAIAAGLSDEYIAHQVGHSSSAVTRRVYASLFNRREQREKMRASMTAQLGGALEIGNGRERGKRRAGQDDEVVDLRRVRR